MTSANRIAKSTADRIETEETFFHTLWAAVAATGLLTIICCGIYPILIWGVAQAVFPHEADGSLVKKDGSAAADPREAVGSALLAQGFSAPDDR